MDDFYSDKYIKCYSFGKDNISVSQESVRRQKSSRKMPDQRNLLIKNAQTNLTYNIIYHKNKIWYKFVI